MIAIDHQREAVSSVGTIYSSKEMLALSKDGVERILLDSGLWAYLDCFPGFGLAPLTINENGEKSSKKIAAVHINLVRTEAHGPDPMLAIGERMNTLVAGINALAKLGACVRVYVQKGRRLPSDVADVATVIEVVDRYPADNLGVQSFYAAALGKDQCVIGADAELTLDVGHLLLHGHKRTERLYCLAGNAAKHPSHYSGRLGIAIGDLLAGALTTTDDVRLISGGLFSGMKVRFQDYLGPKDLGVQAMVEDKLRIPFAFFRLGADRLTLSRTWLSAFKNNVEHEATTNNNGEERACIQCGYCIDICPVKLMPNLIMKAAVTKDIERMEWLSIEDCVDCGLCTFVCPSKIELGHEIDGGKKLIEKEG